MNRKTLFHFLENILYEDELHLFSILSQRPKLQIRVGDTLGDPFETTIGIMQGDVLSAILFIFYLACCLAQETTQESTKFLLAPKYSDDITYATTNKSIFDQLQHTTSTKLKHFNLSVNASKTTL